MESADVTWPLFEIIFNNKDVMTPLCPFLNGAQFMLIYLRTTATLARFLHCVHTTARKITKKGEGFESVF